jgi:hypothetical protein
MRAMRVRTARARVDVVQFIYGGRMKREIEVGSLVVPVAHKVNSLRMAFPNEPLSERSQFLVTAVVARGVYKRKCYMVKAHPTKDPVAVWGTQIRLMSSKQKPDERWS